MKNRYVITVNGKSYDVEVSKVGETTNQKSENSTVLPKLESKPQSFNAQQVPEAKPIELVCATPQGGDLGATKITAPMPGTVIKVSVSPGQSVSKGQVLLILEAMKMENEIVAPCGGTIATVNVSAGSKVNNCDVLISIN